MLLGDAGRGARQPRAEPGPEAEARTSLAPPAPEVEVEAPRPLARTKRH
jgi:hypothetical protein